MADIFLSYSSTDRERVRPIVAALEAEGFSVWWDRSIVPGSAFEPEIEHEIEVARCVVVIWSNASVGSQWVQGEAAEGLQRGILVPVMLEDVRPPLLFRHHDAADFRKWRGNADHPELQRLRKGVAAMIAGHTSQEVEQTHNHVSPSRTSRHAAGMTAAALLLIASALGLYWFESSRPGESVDYSVAVAEFINQSDGESDYLGFGISRQVRDLLGRVEQVQVASRTSTTTVATGDAVSLGDLPGVRYFVEGSIDGDADNFEIDVHLVDTRSGLRIWTQRYRGDRERLLDVTHNIALDIAAAMGVEISAVAVSRLRAKPSDSPEAVEQYLIGSELLLRRHVESELEEAEAAFRRALDYDRDFAHAYAGLCQVYLSRYQATRDVTLYEQAEMNCDKTIQLDDLQVDPRVALGYLYTASGDFERAIESFDVAIELAPVAPEPLLGLAQAFEGLGDPQRAEKWYRNTVQRFPGFLRARTMLGTMLFNQGRFDEAIPVYSRVVAQSPESLAAYVGLGAANLMLGNFNEALDAWQSAQKLQDNVLARSNTGTAYFFLGRLEEARQMYQRAAEMNPRDYRVWGQLGDVSRLLNEPDRADEAYAKAIDFAHMSLEVNTRDATANAQLAEYLAHAQQAEAAETYIGKALELAPTDHFIHYSAAVAYLRLDNITEARSAIERAIALGYPEKLVAADPQLADLNL